MIPNWCNYNNSTTAINHNSTCTTDSWITYTDYKKLRTITSSITQGYIKQKYTICDLEEAFYEGGGNPLHFRKLGNNKEYLLPDEAKIKIDDKGNYTIEDKDAKVKYLANRIKEFNPYINASDLLARFVEYVGSLGLRRSEVLKLPIELFISWLILEAAKKDGDTQPDNILDIPKNPVIKNNIKPRCLVCGQFIKRVFVQKKFEFCSELHSGIYLRRLQLC